MQCGRTVRGRPVHIDLLLEQRPKRRFVLLARGFGEHDTAGTTAHRDGCTRHRQQQSGTAGAYEFRSHIVASVGFRYTLSSSILPVLLPSLSRCTPNLSMSAMCRFASGSPLCTMCVPALSVPEPLPASTTGMFSGRWMLPSLKPDP